jgi:DNA recombination protein RmuC
VAVLLLAGLIFALLTLRRASRNAGFLRDEITQLTADLASATTRLERVAPLELDLAQMRLARDGELHAKVQSERELHILKGQHEIRLEELKNAKQELEDRFAALANQVLTHSSETLLKQVTERFDKHKTEARDDLEKRHHAIEALVKPLGERLGTFDQKISDIEKARNEAYGQIRTQVDQLRLGQTSLEGETRKLVQALRTPKTRGRWGEMQLRQVFEMAGMAENVDYTLEQHIDTDDGARRPDAVVKIPGGKSIIVDAKTPMIAYLDAIDAETPDLQAGELARHAAHVRQHVKLLSSKAYQSLLDHTPDFVVMFIPGENFVASAVEVDPNLIEYAFENKVLIATPTTLMALVKAIAYGWQQEKMAENALEVQKLARDLYDRLATFGTHVGAIGKALHRSVESYNKAVGSLEGRVLPSARKFETLGVVPAGSQIEPPAPVESDPRRLAAPELLTASDLAMDHKQGDDGVPK